MKQIQAMTAEELDALTDEQRQDIWLFLKAKARRMISLEQKP